MARLRSYNGFSFSSNSLFDDSSWDCHILLLDVCDGYYRITLDTYEETIEFLCENIGYHWIFFPQYDSGTVLGNYNNIEFNFRKLYDIFNEHDAISIARSLPEIEKHLRFQKEKEEFA